MLGLNLNEVDCRGSTPLHWACYSQSETALAYLLAWNPKLNLQDKEGYTPLHLAIKSIDELGSCRQVRALLIKGANPNITDMKGRPPLFFCDEIQSDYLQEEAKGILTPSS